MRYALIIAGIVTNIVVWDGVTAFHVPGGATLVPTATANIGDSYNGSTFTPATLTPPQTLTCNTAGQAILALAVRLGNDVGSLVAVIAGKLASATVTAQAGDPGFIPPPGS